MIKEKGFKRNEGLARRVMEILINDYLNKDRIRNLNDRDYLELIEWSLKDYESMGYNVLEYRKYLEVLKELNN